MVQLDPEVSGSDASGPSEVNQLVRFDWIACAAEEEITRLGAEPVAAKVATLERLVPEPDGASQSVIDALAARLSPSLDIAPCEGCELARYLLQFILRGLRVHFLQALQYFTEQVSDIFRIASISPQINETFNKPAPNCYRVVCAKDPFVSSQEAGRSTELGNFFEVKFRPSITKRPVERSVKFLNRLGVHWLRLELPRKAVGWHLPVLVPILRPQPLHDELVLFNFFKAPVATEVGSVHAPLLQPFL